MAAPGLGASAWCGWSEEVTWGTAVARTAFYKLAGGETLRKNQTFFNDPSLGGASIEEVIPGTSSIGGELPLPVRFEGLELLFKHLLGSVASVQQGATAAYKHTFSPADALNTGLSIELYRDMPSTKAFLAVGCKITKGAFRVERDKTLMFGAAFHGKSETLETKSTPSFPTAALAIPSQLVVTTGSFTGTVDVLSGGFEINNPVTEDRFDLAASSALKQQQRSDKRSVLCNIEGEFSEEAQYTDWTAATEGQLIWTWTGAQIAAPYNYELVVTMNGIITARPPQVADAGPVKMPLSFQAFKNGATPDIKIELTNTIVSV